MTDTLTTNVLVIGWMLCGLMGIQIAIGSGYLKNDNAHTMLIVSGVMFGPLMLLTALVITLTKGDYRRRS